ncbi:MAG: hypothetical protein HZC17_08570 [Candidatus Omnitrophica bacterium]|nr:hypothetical protein [Candidatus Omnitrophota bacterium]
MTSWEENIEKEYEWAHIQNLREELLFNLYKAEDEEEASVYLIQLHLDNAKDLKFFSESERKRIKEILMILIKETQKHRELLDEVVDEIEAKIKKEKQK